jgi:hypothetical protein
MLFLENREFLCVKEEKKYGKREQNIIFYRKRHLARCYCSNLKFFKLISTEIKIIYLIIPRPLRIED